MTLVAAAVVAVTAGPAAAATPQQIYRDLADNGRLDRTYSPADVNRALRNPSIPGYARPERYEREPQSFHPARTPAPTDDARTLPFSGLDLALFGAVSLPLLLLGGSLGRFVRARATGH